MDLLRAVTPYVTGTSVELGGSGDPSPATAWGVFSAMGAAAQRLWGTRSLEGRHVVVSASARSARRSPATSTRPAPASPSPTCAPTPSPPWRPSWAQASSPPRARPSRSSATSSRPVPLGAVLDRRHDPAPALRCRCAALPTTSWPPMPTASAWRAAGVLYVPDFVANAGGVDQHRRGDRARRLRPGPGLEAGRGHRRHPRAGLRGRSLGGVDPGGRRQPPGGGPPASALVGEAEVGRGDQGPERVAPLGSHGGDGAAAVDDR